MESSAGVVDLDAVAVALREARDEHVGVLVCKSQACKLAFELALSLCLCERGGGPTVGTDRARRRCWRRRGWMGSSMMVREKLASRSRPF
jgi:hypothetical protein